MQYIHCMLEIKKGAIWHSFYLSSCIAYKFLIGLSYVQDLLKQLELQRPLAYGHVLQRHQQQVLSWQQALF